jgi:hypothetical protein
MAVAVVGMRTPLRRFSVGEWRRILVVAIHTSLLALYVTVFLLLMHLGSQQQAR